MISTSDIISAIEQSGEALIFTDEHGMIGYVTPPVRALTGYTKSELFNREFFFLFSENNPPDLYDRLLKSIASRKPWTGPLEILQRNGARMRILLSVHPFTGRGSGKSGMLCSLHDPNISHATPLLATRLSGNASKSERLFEQYAGEFASVLELIEGFSAVMRSSSGVQADKTTEEYLSFIEQGSHWLLGAMEDVVYLAQLETGREQFRMEPLAVGRELRLLTSRAKLLFESKDIRVVRVIEDTKALIWIDRRCFARIISNLLVNALKFTRQGSVTIGLQVRDHHAEVSITDTGVGISEAFKAEVFKPFHQEESGFVPDLDGAGLGLTITKRLTEFMGGRIVFSSEKMQGSRFAVRFPVIGREQEAPERIQTSSETPHHL